MHILRETYYINIDNELPISKSFMRVINHIF